MTIRVANHLFKKRIVRNTAGQIIDWFDEADGGWIIQKGQIVNTQKYDEIQQKEKDKKEAAKAILFQKVDDVIPDRTVTATEAVKNSTKLEELETRLNKQDEKLDAILNALKK